MKKAVIGIMFLIALANQAQAADTFKYSTAGAWTIAVDPTIGDGRCFAVINFEGGASFRLGFDVRNSSDLALSVLLGNIKWKSIEYGKNYSIKMRFGGQLAWEGKAVGFSFDPPNNQTWLRLTITHQKISSNFMKEFMRENFLSLDYKEKEILRLSLKDSFQAGLQLLECQKEVRREKQDPFRDTSSPNDDPFR